MYRKQEDFYNAAMKGEETKFDEDVCTCIKYN